MTFVRTLDRHGRVVLVPITPPVPVVPPLELLKDERDRIREVLK